MLSGVPFTSIVQQGDTTWTFSWATTSAVSYRIVLFGQQIDTTTTNSYNFSFPGYEKYPPPLEIMADNQVALSEQFQPFLTMQWYGETCDYFSVSEFVSSVWNMVNTVMENGTTVYTVQTPLLNDGETHQYGIAAVTNEVPSTMQQYLITVVTPPDWVDGSVSFSYSGGNLIVSAA